jgi:hypothetical protein
MTGGEEAAAFLGRVGRLAEQCLAQGVALQAGDGVADGQASAEVRLAAAGEAAHDHKGHGAARRRQGPNAILDEAGVLQ